MAPDIRDREAFYRYYIDDENLELDFFQYSSEMRELIRVALKFKASHNLERMGFFDMPAFTSDTPAQTGAPVS